MHNAQPSLSNSQQRTIRWLFLAIAIAVILPAVLFAAVTIQRYRQITEEQTRNIARISHVMSEHALKMFDTSEVLLRHLLDITRDMTDQEIVAQEAELHARLNQMVRSLPQVQSVWILNDEGRPLVTNRSLPAPKGLDLSDRESFQSCLAGRRDLFIGGALRSEQTGEAIFELAQRRDFRDGRFAGILKVSLRPAYLAEFYRSISTDEKGITLTLVRSDGSLIARWPQAFSFGDKLGAESPLLPLMQEGKASGILRAISTFDGKERFLSYRKVGAHDVYAVTGLPIASVRMLCLRELGILALFVVPGAAALVVIGLVALRKTRKELHAANQLRRESQHRQKMEDALRQTRKMEALGHLTGGMAHDFNNLMMVVEMNAHFLEQTQPALHNHPRIAAIRRAVSTGTRLTRQLLSFARRQPLVAKTIHLQDSLPPLLELCRHVLPREVTSTLEIAPDTPPISIDTAELELALINLAVNAGHAMPQGGSFCVQARRSGMAGEHDGVEIRVQDTGEGIAPEHLDRVFEPFYTTRPGSGSGLGLSQVYGMCARMGGSVRIDSKSGTGTAIVMRLPAAAGMAEARHRNQHRAPLPQLGHRILLVEDNDDIANVLQPMLELAGCSVVRRASADEAVACLADVGRDIDAVLSDIAMPGLMNGIDLARRLRKTHPHLAVMLMTGFTDRLTEAEELGLQVLPKPISLAALMAALAEAVPAASSVDD